MSDESSVDDVAKAVGVVGQLYEVAAKNDDTSAAAKSLAKSLSTIATTVEVCLLPLAAINFGYKKARDYFQNDFERELGEKVGYIPLENLVEPDPIIAGPAIQGLGLASDISSLKDMYLSLLATTMDGREFHKAHPSYPEIIRQLSSEGASFLRAFKDSKIISCVEIRQKVNENGYIDLTRHLMQVNLNESENHWNDSLPAMLENFQRLGLIQIDYNDALAGPGAYEWVESHPVYLEFKRLNGELAGDGEAISYGRGIIRRTNFGQSFLNVVLSD